MKNDWWTIIGITLMLISLTVSITYYYNLQNKECISEPLVYGAKQLEEKYGYEFYGTGSFLLPPNTKPLRFVFNSSTISVQTFD